MACSDSFSQLGCIRRALDVEGPVDGEHLGQSAGYLASETEELELGRHHDRAIDIGERCDEVCYFEQRLIEHGELRSRARLILGPAHRTRHSVQPRELVHNLDYQAHDATTRLLVAELVFEAEIFATGEHFASASVG